MKGTIGNDSCCYYLQEAQEKRKSAVTGTACGLCSYYLLRVRTHVTCRSTVERICSMAWERLAVGSERAGAMPEIPPLA